VIAWQKALMDPASALATALKARLKPTRKAGQVVQATRLAQR
jgi:hypothetical protein